MNILPKFISVLKIFLKWIFSIFLIISVLSYHSEDYSLSTFSDKSRVKNYTGILGSMTADVLIQIFGISSVLIPILIIIYEIAKNKYKIIHGLYSFTIGAIITISFLSPILFVIAPNISIKYLNGGITGKLLKNLPLTTQICILIFGIVTMFSSGFFIGAKSIWHRILIKISKTNEVKYDNSVQTISKKSLTKQTSCKESKKNKLIGGSSEIELTHKETSTHSAKTQNITAINTSFLVPKEKVDSSYGFEEAKETQRKLENVLKEFGVNGKITNTQIGPVVTMYELEPSAGTKSARIIGLADDIARSMSAISARISVISGRNAIGIELPNTIREVVRLREIIESSQYQNQDMTLPIALGKTLNGDSFVVDLARMPHLLVAGTTGSGKSVAINAMILSLLYKKGPDQCKMIMIDPKMLELSIYDGIPHLLCPVVIDPKKASTALKWIVREMENRYKVMSKVGVRNIEGYNKKIQEYLSENKVLEKKLQTGFNKETGEPIFETEKIEMKTFHYIVVIVDEMADLMLVAGKEIESSVQRLAQMARASGIHIIMATQRPSVDVITGVIKANFPTRISFAVTSKIDSRTILGEQGAEQLLGMGDMLYMAAGGKITRVHGPFVDDSEVKKIVDFLKTQAQPEYIEEVTSLEDSNESDEENSSNDSKSGDDLYEAAKNIVFSSKKTSISYVQRQLRIGYNRAANLIEKMEREGLLTPPNHAGKREIAKTEN